MFLKNLYFGNSLQTGHFGVYGLNYQNQPCVVGKIGGEINFSTADKLCGKKLYCAL